MKTIKLFKKIKNNASINAFDLSKYENVKHLSIDDIANKIAIKNGISIDEIKKEYGSELELKHKQNFNLFIEKKIVDDMAITISGMIFNGNLPPTAIDNSLKNACFIKHKYNEKTKTFENELCYENSIKSKIFSNKKEIEVMEDFLKDRRKLEDGTYERFSKSKFLRRWGTSLWNSRIERTNELKKDITMGMPKYVKHWTTPEGKKEIELIEKTLEDLGKIKFEIYDAKGKKIETLYAKYKRTNETWKSNQIIVHMTTIENGYKREIITNEIGKPEVRLSLVKNKNILQSINHI